MAEKFRLGVVSPDSPAQWRKYVGRLVIPYLDKMGVYAFNFRCLAHDDCKKFDCKKYLNPSGQEKSLFHVTAVDDEVSEVMHICEGEMDAMALAPHVGYLTVGIPGADTWLEHWHTHFMGFSRVFVWQHGDTAGEKLSKRIREVVKVAEIIELPSGEDVNSLMLSWGAEKVLALVDVEEE